MNRFNNLCDYSGILLGYMASSYRKPVVYAVDKSTPTTKVQDLLSHMFKSKEPTMVLEFDDLSRTNDYMIINSALSNQVKAFGHQVGISELKRLS